MSRRGGLTIASVSSERSARDTSSAATVTLTSKWAGPGIRSLLGTHIIYPPLFHLLSTWPLTRQRDGLFLQIPTLKHSADAQDRGVPRS